MWAAEFSQYSSYKSVHVWIIRMVAQCLQRVTFYNDTISELLSPSFWKLTNCRKLKDEQKKRTYMVLIYSCFILFSCSNTLLSEKVFQWKKSFDCNWTIEDLVFCSQHVDIHPQLIVIILHTRISTGNIWCRVGKGIFGQ